MVGRLRITDIRPGNLQVHWPEGNVLIKGGVRDPESGEPHCNAIVSVEALPPTGDTGRNPAAPA